MAKKKATKKVVKKKVTKKVYKALSKAKPRKFVQAFIEVPLHNRISAFARKERTTVTEILRRALVSLVKKR